MADTPKNKIVQAFGDTVSVELTQGRVACAALGVPVG